MLPDNFYGFPVLVIYKCGSEIYGLANETSDADYTVIVDGYDGLNVEKEDGVDYFVFGLSKFKELVTFVPSNLSYFLLWMDNTLVAESNLVFIDEEFRDEFLALINIDWAKYFKAWLRINYDYFKVCFEAKVNLKVLYNLYRVRSLVSNYEATGTFAHTISEEDLALMQSYKNEVSNKDEHYKNFAAILVYLKEVLERED